MSSNSLVVTKCRCSQPQKHQTREGKAVHRPRLHPTAHILAMGARAGWHSTGRIWGVHTDITRRTERGASCPTGCCAGRVAFMQMRCILVGGTERGRSMYHRLPSPMGKGRDTCYIPDVFFNDLLMLKGLPRQRCSTEESLPGLRGPLRHLYHP